MPLWSETHSAVSDSLWPHEPTRLLCPWNSAGQNTGVGSHSLLQGDLPNPGIEPRSPALQAEPLPTELPGKPQCWSLIIIVVVQLLSHVQLFATLWTAARQASGFCVLHYLPEFAQTHAHWVSDATQTSHPLLRWLDSIPFLFWPSIFSSIRDVSSESALYIRWPEYWTFAFSISPSIEYSGLISFRIDWLDLFAVQGTLRSLLQHHSWKASNLQCSAYFVVQLSHPYFLQFLNLLP